MDESATASPERGGWRLPLAVYTGLSLAVLAPALTAPLRLAIGHPDSDIWKHLWHHWLVRDGLGEGMIGCYRIPWLAAPEGACLLDADLVNNIAVLPVSVLSIPLATHLLIAAQLVAAALAANLVARRLTGSRTAALVAGCAYAFSCAVLFHAVASGVHERLHLALPAVGLWLALRFRDEGRWRDLVLFTVATAVLALASPAYSVFLGLAMVLVAPVDVALAAQGEPAVGRPRAALRWLGTGLCALAVFAAVGWLTSRCVAEESHGGRGFGGDPDSLSAWPSVTAPTDVAGKMETLPLECFLSPGALDTCASRDVDFLYRYPYAGYVLMVLAAAGVVLGRRRRSRALAVLGFVVLLISFGPVLRWHADDSAHWVAHPTLWLARLVPFVHRTHVWQLVPMAQLLLAVGAVELLATRVPASWRHLAVACAVILLLGETALAGRSALPLPVTDTRIPAIYGTLVEHTGAARAPESILLDLPSHARDPRIGGGRYLWYQSAHQRALPYTINPGRFEDDPLVGYVEDGRGGLSGASEALGRWITDGADHVVLHLGHASDEEEQRVIELMQAAGAVRIHGDDEHVLFELPGYSAAGGGAAASGAGAESPPAGGAGPGSPVGAVSPSPGGG